jgi:hypothetical protein
MELSESNGSSRKDVVLHRGELNMKKMCLLALLSSVAFAVGAQQPNSGQGNAATPPQSQQNQQMQMQMQQMQQLEGRMQAMRAQMEAIQKTKDPAERQRLLDEHAKSMQQGMMMMGQMMGGPGGAQAQGGRAQNDTQCQMQRMQGQQQMMGQQMGMMQKMMEQMMGQMMMQSGVPPQTGETPKQQNHEEHH